MTVKSASSFKYLLLLSFLIGATARRRNTTKALLYASIGFIVLLVIGSCAYCIRKLFPEGIRFIRLPDEDDESFDNVEDIESRLQKNADSIKKKLDQHQQQRRSLHSMDSRRPISRLQQERAERFNDRGMKIYGAAWADGSIPVRDVIAMSDHDAKNIREDAEKVAEEFKNLRADGKEDLWQQWNVIHEANRDSHPSPSAIAAFVQEKERANSNRDIESSSKQRPAPPPVMKAPAPSSDEVGRRGFESTNKAVTRVTAAPKTPPKAVDVYSGKGVYVNAPMSDDDDDDGVIEHKASNNRSASRSPLNLGSVSPAPAHIRPPPSSKLKKSSGKGLRDGSRFPIREKVINEKSHGEAYSMNIEVQDLQSPLPRSSSALSTGSGSNRDSQRPSLVNRRPSTKGRALPPPRPSTIQLQRPGTSGVNNAPPIVTAAETTTASFRAPMTRGGPLPMSMGRAPIRAPRPPPRGPYAQLSNSPGQSNAPRPRPPTMAAPAGFRPPSSKQQRQTTLGGDMGSSKKVT